MDISSANDINFFDSIGFIVGEHGYILKTSDFGITWKLITTDVNENFNTVNIIN